VDRGQTTLAHAAVRYRER